MRKFIYIPIICSLTTLYGGTVCPEDGGEWLDEYGPPANNRGRVRAACCPPGCITPEAGPCVCQGWGAQISADFIYWTVRQDHLGYAYKESLEPGVGIVGQGHVHHPDWNFEPGFKVGVSILQNHDGWDVRAEYTWLTVRNTKDSVSIDDPFTQQIIPIGDFGAAGGLVDIEKMSADWELDFNVVDFSLGRNFYISPCLSLRPHFGLKGTWQEQRYFVSSLGSFDTIFAEGVNKDKLDYWGVGIRGGLNSTWHITRAIGFLGNVAVSTLWERFIIDSFSANYPLDETDPSTVLIDVENRFFTVKPVVELFLGFQWQTWFCCDTYRFTIIGGWEEQWWADQNQFFLPLIESRQGDLFFHGGTLSLRLDF